MILYIIKYKIGVTRDVDRFQFNVTYSVKEDFLFG